MKRMLCFLAALSFLCSFSFPARADIDKYITRPSSFRPLTDEEILTFKDKSFNDKLRFLTVYYLENKATYNATDEAVLNEMIKLDPQLALTIIKASENISKGSATFKEYYRQAAAEINVAMKERYPDNPEYLLDPDDYTSVTKLARLVEVSGFSLDFTEAWSQARSFSETKKFDFGEAMLYACARTEKDDILMGLSVFLKPGFVLLRQREGEAPNLVSADYSLSDNMTAKAVSYPRADRFSENGQKFAAYADNVVFPFYAHIVDNEKSAALAAVFSFTVCRLDAECQEVRTPVLKQSFSRKSALETPVCYDLQSVERTLPENDDIGIRFKKTALRQKNGETFLFVLMSDAVLNFRVPVLTIDNAAGLKFDEPLFSQKDGQFLFSVKILNPEKLTFPVDLKLTVSLEKRATETTVTINAPQTNGNLFSPTIYSYIKTFGFGVEFLFLTPLLTLFCFLFYQMGLTPFAGKKQTTDYICGAGAVLFVFAAAFFAFGADGKTFLSAMYGSVYLNCVLMAAFFASPIAYFFTADKLPALLSSAKIKRPAAVQGAVCAAIACVYLCLTPQIENIAKVSDLVEKQGFFGYGLFILGILTPFAALAAFQNKIVAKSVFVPPYVKVLLCVGTVAQGGIAVVLFAFDTAVLAGAGLAIAVIAAVFVLINRKITENVKCFLPLFLLSAGLALTPLRTQRSETPEFSEELLHKTLDRKGVLLVSADASGCVSCRYNLLTAKQAKDRIGQSVDLVVAAARPDNAVIAAIVKEAEMPALPFNILFSKKYPNGYFLPQTITLESVTGALRQADELE